MRAYGLDVSVWQDNNSTAQQVDFKKAKAAGASFVYIKASQRRLDEDIMYNWKSAKDAGLLRGAYHYLDPRMPVLDQAKLFCNILANDPGELPPVCDFEQRTENGIVLPPVDVWRGWLWNFLTFVEKELGIVPGIYTGYYYWYEFGTKDKAWSRYPLWLAWWEKESIIKAPPPWSTWTFWQYTPKGDGIYHGCESKGVDLNFFNGTVDELYNYARISTPVPEVKLCPTCNQPWEG